MIDNYLFKVKVNHSMTAKCCAEIITIMKYGAKYISGASDGRHSDGEPIMATITEK
jgi:hypothetical protein